MANAKKKAGKVSGKVAAGVGAGLVAAAAAAGAGYYFYFGKQAKNHRRIAAKWAGDLKKEVAKQVKKAKAAERQAVVAIVDQVSSAYRGAKSVDAKDLLLAAGELKDNWQEIAHEIKVAGRGAVKKIRTVTAKAKKAVAAVKKVAKKPARR
jgi:hypothetical protein